MTRMIMASCGEPGCIEDSYAVDILDPTLIRISERWVRRSALAAHGVNCSIAWIWTRRRNVDASGLLQYRNNAAKPDTREKFF